MTRLRIFIAYLRNGYSIRASWILSRTTDQWRLK